MKRLGSHAQRSAVSLTLPDTRPLRLVDRHGQRVDDSPLPSPAPETLRRLYRGMVLGRRFDRQAGALARQGRLAVYPSSYGQEACQVGGVLALSGHDWLFPTYRDSVSLVTRGVPPGEVLTLFRGDWHNGYDPHAHRCAPQCTPLATNAPHAVGLTYAARRKGEDTAALVIMGDGATSEGDAHEAYNFAAVWNTPVVFLVQNNRWAISVPVQRQSAAPTLAHKAVGYGMRGYHVDGNDAAAVYTTVHHALAEARSGGGPAIVEATTYRLDPHTNADAPQRYRDPAEVEYWYRRDPVERLRTLLLAEEHLDEDRLQAVAEEGERLAEHLRETPDGDASGGNVEALFAHIYATPPQLLREQAAALRAEFEEG